jgi:hypothetical protein
VSARPSLKTPARGLAWAAPLGRLEAHQQRRQALGPTRARRRSEDAKVKREEAHVMEARAKQAELAAARSAVG